METSPSSSTAARLSTRLSSIRTTLATKLPPRVLLPTVAKCYNNMVTERKVGGPILFPPASGRKFHPVAHVCVSVFQGQLGALMSILKEHIGQLEKDQLSFHQSELTSFFLIALDFRAKHSGVSSMLLCAPGTVRRF